MEGRTSLRNLAQDWLFECVYISDWWFGTFSIFPYIGNNHPNGLIFFRGVETTNQYICIYTGFILASP